MSGSYAIDGKCHNAEPGTHGHECGKPAVYVGETRTGFRSGFCADCRRNGSEARGAVSCMLYNQLHEVSLVVNREHRDQRGFIDEVAMRSLFNFYNVPLNDRVRIWRALTA